MKRRQTNNLHQRQSERIAFYNNQVLHTVTYSHSQTTNNAKANEKEFLNENNPWDMMFALLCVCSKPSARIRFARTLSICNNQQEKDQEELFASIRIQIQILI